MNFARRVIPFLWLYLVVFSFNADAHPMPNTDISIRLDDTFVNLEIKIPVPEFVLAFPQTEQVNAANILTDSREKVDEYFRKHLKILSRNGAIQDYKITSMNIQNASDEFVGEYSELNLSIEVPVREGFDPRDFSLEYDAVIHQIPNHFALVKITQDFDNGLIENEKAVSVGAIRYDFANNSVPPLVVTAQKGGIFKGFYSMIALGMQHIITGTDHILFLLTLLIVAPIAVKDGKWTLFQGVGFTLRRFLQISSAFTLGHSAALICGAYNFFSVNEKFVEVMIAVSILITAVHAIRPIFPEKEIFVAFGFGLIHGLAFSEVLKSLQLSPLDKAVSIFGFNIGIELMQLAIMILTFPILLLSKYKFYDLLRIIFACVTFLTACFWVMTRLQ